MSRYDLWCVFRRVFFFKQKTAYEMRISDWSSDVCSSDLRFGLESDRQRLAVGAMFFEIHQHQPAREKQVEYRPPALFGREELVAVEQHQLVRLGADERHAATAKAFRAINLAVEGDHAVGEAHGIAKLRERGAEQRDAVGARNIVARAFGSARQPVLRVGAEEIGRAHV